MEKRKNIDEERLGEGSWKRKKGRRKKEQELKKRERADE